MPNAITGEASGAGATIVCHAVGNMDASGNASLTTLQQLSVSVQYDDRYDITLSAENSTKLANAFTVDGSGNTFTATLSNPAHFEEVLAYAMENAVLVTKTSTVDPTGADASVAAGLGLSLGTVINNGILNQFKQIFTDTLPNILQSDWTMSSGVDWAGGAVDMREELVDAECEILAQQIPESNYELYMDASENPSTTALSLKDGDSVIFVMDVSVEVSARAITKTPGASSDTGASAVPGAGAAGVSPYGYNTNINAYTNNSRRVAFKLIVAKDPENTADAKLANLTPAE